MKKIFTLAFALLGFAGIANAATVDDIAVCKHSYVLVFDDWCGNGTAKPGKGQLFGNGYFLDVTGGSVSTGKGSVNLSVVNEADEYHVTQAIADKYGADYPDAHLNSWRLKNAQDVIAMKVTAGSKLIFFLHGNAKSGTSARIPKIAKDAALNEALNAAPGEDFPTTDTGFRYEWTAEDDGLIYIGSYNGDTFFSYLIVEANEAEGTPSLKVGDQTFENGLWYREVSCKPGQAYGMGTIVTYTTDGTEPTAASPVYTEPIKVYKDATLKFQAFMDLGTGTADASGLLQGADNEANVNFKFEAPSIDADGATVTITSPYEGAENYILVNGENEEKTNSITLEESATITAYSKIINGDYAEFISNSTSKDVYVLNPIKEKKTIAVTTGTAVLDEEATEKSTTGEVYKVEDGAISADKMDFFVKNLTFAVVKNADYQIDGKEIYIQMSNTNITFQVAEGDSVDVKVVCSKNSCKNLEADDAAADKLVNGCTPDRSCYVNVSGKNYCHLDADGGVAADLKMYPEANVITFGLPAGTHTFQKYSGTGNILISSIEITPVVADPSGIAIVKNENAKSAIFNLAGQKVNGNFKGIIVKNGKKILK
ncbi:chitobiase/beta-hexosaminidase C-terminal domain-containing protein [Prevotella sp. E2-28]|uniref:chitobiase/beta-hexosaminidase C-terminal domain-containing protein n=1 Tax=Prevotella sp. E2-28 TaxID=2913620 RepID=UPI001ED9F0A2|nr:chitobiase/beta-hexosaminidase C-terminal domain-containing protein [Prevotella sp. E2-28]UKK52957.1 chitobiase/beta-hexosaminidase C-terminal domain-containing protein [Prevotella sp. E2-28]